MGKFPSGQLEYEIDLNYLHMKATRQSRDTLKPMTEKYELVDIHLPVTAEEFQRISEGSAPVEMGDRFFAFMEGNSLHIYTFTGTGLYMVFFRPEGNGYIGYLARIPKDPAVKPVVDNVSEVGYIKATLRGLFGIESF